MTLPTGKYFLNFFYYYYFKGKWRVITKHVQDKHLLIVRFATGFEVRRGIINPVNRLREEELNQQQLPRVNSGKIFCIYFLYLKKIKSLQKLCTAL